MAADSKTKKTIITLRRHKKEKEKTVLVTAYDYPQALIADKAGSLDNNNYLNNFFE